MTNADYIRSLDDVKLAKVINIILWTFIHDYSSNTSFNLYAGTLNWLQSENIWGEK